MNLGKGIVLSLLAAGAACAAWYALITWSGWSLWLFAPVVGLAAGAGMVCGAEKAPGARVGAAIVALIAIAITRFVAVSHEVTAMFGVTHEDAVDYFAAEVAEELQAAGATDVYDAEGNYTAGVYSRAEKRWKAMPAGEQDEFLANAQSQVSESTAFVTPLALLFDFGIFGTLWTIGAAATAAKFAGSSQPDDTEESPEAIAPQPFAHLTRRAEESRPAQGVGPQGAPHIGAAQAQEAAQHKRAA